jgi:hypothetical protein
VVRRDIVWKVVVAQDRAGDRLSRSALIIS